jgi:hypothetical protein
MRVVDTIPAANTNGKDHPATILCETDINAITTAKEVR